MIFKIKSAYDKEIYGKKETLITGFLSPNYQSEVDGMPQLIEVFTEVETFNNKLSSNGKTLLFKSVESQLLFNVMHYMGEALEFPIRYEFTKNFVGSKSLVDDALKRFKSQNK